MATNRLLIALHLSFQRQNSFLWKLHCPITMCWRDTPKFAPLGIIFEVLETCSWNIQTGHVNLTEHVFSQSKRLRDTKIHLNKTCIDKSLIINVLHRCWHIHLLHNRTIKSMFTDTLQALWQVDFLQPPTAHEGAIWNIRNTIRKNDGCQLLACTKCKGAIVVA